MNNLFYKNEYIFSEIYLQEITRVEEDIEVLAKLSVIKEYRDFSDSSNLSKWNSSFIYEVLNALAFSHEIVNDNITLLKQIGKPENISLCFSILPVEDINNTSMGRNWAEKTIRYLKTNNLKWGILTNGNKWRIYHTEESTPYENYLEIDLDKILENDDVSQYQIFHKFMKADNFVLDAENKCKFDIYKKESQDKIDYIEEELKNALKQREGEGGKGVLSDLCMGYVEFLRSKGITDFDKEDLRKTIYASAMLYMFRLLFIFYATSRNLLKDTDQELFFTILNDCSINLQKGISDKNTFSIWNSLRKIYSEIDLTYNGGLFDPRDSMFSEFIENNRISDYYLSRVIYYMNYFEDKDGIVKPISYRDMGVRHLGTLYEGLLEHKLFVAEEDMEIRILTEGIKFIPVSEGGKLIEGMFIKKGQVYFGNDKNERQSTGSYYTPEYIVDYIVSNTVGEKLNELKCKFINDNKDNIDAIYNSINFKDKQSLKELLYNKQLEFINNHVLKLSVLDPAMGSGHFLINATNRISNFITEFLNEYDVNSDKSSSVIYWRRRIVENCIFGVDINPLAVELAKLSHWIFTMARDAHLSFLNHHLKCGNSLIGAKLSDIGIYPYNKSKSEKKKEITLFEQDPIFKGTVEKVISDYFAIENRETVLKEDIDFKKDLLNDINEALKPYKKICDLHTSIYFDNTILESDYFSMINNPERIIEIKNDYFHWELEFPEKFNNNHGFDIIIGNPPYVFIDDIQYIQTVPLTYETNNLFCYFSELAFKMCTEGGFHSFIVPLSGFAMSEMKPYQDLIINCSSSLNIINFSWRPCKIFDDVNIPVSIFISKKKNEFKNNLENVFTTHYLRWYKHEIGAPINKIKFIDSKNYLNISPGFIPKIGEELDIKVLDKVLKHEKLENYITKKDIKDSDKIYYRSKGGLYYKIFTNFFTGSTNEIAFRCKDISNNLAIIAILNSNLFFWFYEIFSSCRVVNFDNIKSFRLSINNIHNKKLSDLKQLGQDLMKSYKDNAEIKIRNYTGFGKKECYTIYARKSKYIMDEIDMILGDIYGLSSDEVSYVTNYMANYRTD